MDINELFACYGITSASQNKEGTMDGNVAPAKDSYVTMAADEEEIQLPARVEEIEQPNIGWQKQRSFAEVISSKPVAPAIPLEPFAMPRIEGGNVTVELNEEECERGVIDNQFSVIGRLNLMKKDQIPTTKELRTKLAEEWNLESFKMIPIGRGFFHIFVQGMEEQSIILSVGAVNLKPGVFRVSRWAPNFNPVTQKQTNSQIWIRIFDLPIEYWKPRNLANIARGSGLPLMIDPRTLNIDFGLYARVLVDADFSKPLPQRILVK